MVRNQFISTSRICDGQLYNYKLDRDGERAQIVWNIISSLSICEGSRHSCDSLLLMIRNGVFEFSCMLNVKALTRSIDLAMFRIPRHSSQSCGQPLAISCASLNRCCAFLKRQLSISPVHTFTSNPSRPTLSFDKSKRHSVHSTRIPLVSIFLEQLINFIAFLISLC